MGPETRHGLDHLEPNVFKLSQWSHPHLSTPHNNGAFRQVGYQLSPKCARKICRAGRNQGQPLSIDTW